MAEREQPGDTTQPPQGLVPTGVEGLDAILGGGLPARRTYLVRGERGRAFLFDETRESWLRRSEGLGLDFRPHLEAGRLASRSIQPAEVSAGELAHSVRTAVEEDGVSAMAIESTNGYRYAMAEETHITVHLHELFQLLNHRGMATLIVVAQHGFPGSAVEEPFNMSYLADTVLPLRYLEAFGRVRTALSVVKKRSGVHGRTIRELLLSSDGVHLGDELHAFQGVISGELTYKGESEPLLRDRGEGE